MFPGPLPLAMLTILSLANAARDPEARPMENIGGLTFAFFCVPEPTATLRARVDAFPSGSSTRTTPFRVP